MRPPAEQSEALSLFRRMSFADGVAVIVFEPERTPPTAGPSRLLHELAHVVLTPRACACASAGARDVEQRCNEIAGETLVLGRCLFGTPSPANRAHTSGPSHHEELARDFGFSEEVVLRRLLEAGLTSRAFYNARRAKFAWRKASSDPDGRGPAIRRAGRSESRKALIRLVFDALARHHHAPRCLSSSRRKDRHVRGDRGEGVRMNEQPKPRYCMTPARSSSSGSEPTLLRISKASGTSSTSLSERERLIAPMGGYLS